MDNNNWIITSKILNIKFPHSIVHNKVRYVYGIRSVSDSGLTKFIPICHTFNESLVPISVNDTLINSDKSILIWNVIRDKEHYVFFVEHKSIHGKVHSCTFHKYIVKPDDLFKMDKYQVNSFPVKISKDYLIFNQCNNIYLASKLEKDINDPDYYWGKYLFEFYDEATDKLFKPLLGAQSRDNDKGHIIHSCSFNGKHYNVVFSIRKQIKSRSFKYCIYSAHTIDFRSFSEISEIKVHNDITSSKWYCYPDITDIILINQDDFGKSKPTLVASTVKMT